MDYLKVGDRVAYCIVRGSYAEYAAVPAARLVKVPREVPLDVATRLGASSERDQPMFVLLQAAGVPIKSAEQYLGATLAGLEAAEALAVEVGAPLLRLVRVVMEASGRPVERVVALYRADRYQYHLHLEAERMQRPPVA